MEESQDDLSFLQTACDVDVSGVDWSGFDKIEIEDRGDSVVVTVSATLPVVSAGVDAKDPATLPVVSAGVVAKDPVLTVVVPLPDVSAGVDAKDPVLTVVGDGVSEDGVSKDGVKKRNRRRARSEPPPGCSTDKFHNDNSWMPYSMFKEWIASVENASQRWKKMKPYEQEEHTEKCSTVSLPVYHPRASQVCNCFFAGEEKYALGFWGSFGTVHLDAEKRLTWDFTAQNSTKALVDVSVRLGFVKHNPRGPSTSSKVWPHNVDPDKIFAPHGYVEAPGLLDDNTHPIKLGDEDWWGNLLPQKSMSASCHTHLVFMKNFEYRLVVYYYLIEKWVKETIIARLVNDSTYKSVAWFNATLREIKVMKDRNSNTPNKMDTDRLSDVESVMEQTEKIMQRYNTRDKVLAFVQDIRSMLKYTWIFDYLEKNHKTEYDGAELGTYRQSFLSQPGNWTKTEHFESMVATLRDLPAWETAECEYDKQDKENWWVPPTYLRDDDEKFVYHSLAYCIASLVETYKEYYGFMENKDGKRNVSLFHTGPPLDFCKDVIVYETKNAMERAC